MKNPQYVTADQSSIRLEVEGGALRVVDREGSSDLFARAEAGEFGAVAPFDPAFDVTPSAESEIVVSRLQAKAALLQMGLLDQVETLMAGLDAMSQLAWREAISYNRDSPMLNALAPYLSWPDGTALTSADLDQLFLLAQSIEV
ncbi:MAG: hypothetical protein ABF313_17070 [Marivita sp.]